jgi:hypothetical protein
MNKLLFNKLALCCMLALCASETVHGQDININASTYLGGLQNDEILATQKVDDAMYLVGSSNSPNFPVTDGSIYKGGNSDVFVTKLDASTGTILFSKMIGSLGAESANQIHVVDNVVHIGGITNGAGFPTTDGSSTTDNVTRAFYTQLNAMTGAVLFTTILPGIAVKKIQVIGSEVHLFGATNHTFPTTDGSLWKAGGNDLTYTKLNAISHAVLTSTIFGGSLSEIPSDMQVVGSEAHLLGVTNSTDYPTTGGITSQSGDLVYTKINTTTGSILISRVISSSEDGFLGRIQVVGNEAHIAGFVDNANLPVTNGSVYAGNGDGFYLKLNTNSGSILHATYLGGSSEEDLTDMKVLNNEVHIIGYTNSTDYPVTSGGGGGNIFYSKIDAGSGALIYSNTYGGEGGFSFPTKLYLSGTDVDILATVVSDDFHSTNGSVHSQVGSGNYDIAYLRISSVTGAVVSGAYLGQGSPSYFIESDANGVYIVGSTNVSKYPVTNSTSFGGSNDIIYTKLSCVTDFTGSQAVTPSTQSVCINGVVSQIGMAPMAAPGSTQPIVYRNGVAGHQPDIEADYQWQQSDALEGPWTDIAGAIAQNYVPASSTITKYYRRIATTSCQGVKTTLQTGDVATVQATSDEAPGISAGGTIYTCLGTSVTLGGSPTATLFSGASSATYLWTPAGTYTPDNVSANPSVMPAISTIYEVLVTDNNGCKQIGHANVSVVHADACPSSAGFCAGTPVRIGTLQSSAPGVTYSWTSTPSGFTSTEAQPLVSPSEVTTYHLTLTLPLAAGGNCTSTDDITVTPVEAPTSNFAGPDVTICSGGTTLLGIAAESGFTYTWAPGNYLTDNHIARPTFQPGSLSQPVPNPFTYYVTALKGGCTFVDQVLATVIKADAGIDGCGPRTIGTPDQTPGIDETYAWTLVSGTAHFLGATNLPIVAVGASEGTTTYRVSVTLNGVTCTDDVIVPPCGCEPPVITVYSPSGCPDFDLAGGAGQVSLTASRNMLSTYIWSPAAGLSATTGSTVYLTDNVERTYTVTATSALDPSIGNTCIQTITVNHEAWSFPLFTPQSVTVCPGVSVEIGQPTVEGYSYTWEPRPGISATDISNPSVTTNASNSYPVLVTDIGSGCTVSATSTVTIEGFPANIAGDDLKFCGSATGVQLGVPALPNVTYLWTSSPEGAEFTPGNSVAQPTVDVSGTTTFTVTATNTITSCSIQDAVTVTVGSPVDPFTLSDNTFCPSTIGALPLPAGPSGMTSYRWTPFAQVLSNTSNGPTATTTNPRPQVATTYTLTVTNASGCSRAQSVTLSPTGTLPDAGSDKNICLSSGPVSLGSASNPTGGGITYAWSPATNLSSASSPNPTFTPTEAGTYTFTLSKTESGCTTTDQVMVVVKDFVLPVMSSPTICQNACVQIGTTAQTGASYIWSPSTGLSSPNVANPMACPAATTIYRLTGQGINGCIASQDVIVTVRETPSPTATIASLTACVGDAAGQFAPVVSPSGSYQYVWTPNDGSLSDVNIVNPMVTVMGAGNKTYNLVVTDGSTGCSGSAQASLTVTLCIPEKMSLGSTVFIDANNDGIQSGAKETGIGGVLVKLYKADGVTVVASTYTDSFGNYLFSDLPEGSYIVGVTPNSTYSQASTPGSGTNTDNQTDGDNNGTQSNIGAESRSALITLTAGQEPVGETGQGGTQDDENDANGDMTIDFGFYDPNASLPVDLINFRATPGEESVDLSWKSANEKAFSHFELLRSVDGKEFVALGIVAGSAANFYGYRDRAPIQGRNYYRLKMVDMDGTSKLSRIISVVFDLGQKYLFVQNPASGKSFVVITNVTDPQIRLFSVSGAPITVGVSALGNNKYLVETRGATTGLYIVTMDNLDKALNKKVIIP